jgi:lysozyme
MTHHSRFDFVFAGVVLVAGCGESVGESSWQQADTVCAPGGTVRGMDVSYYDDVTDWTTARQAGIEFAFIRVSDGTQFHDPKFAAYWASAKASGVIRSAYQFFRPDQDPIAQADLLLQTMGPLEPGDLPPVIDVEVADGRSHAQVAAAVRAWVDRVSAAIDRPPIVYTGFYAWADLTGGADQASSPLWIAQYTTAPCPTIPSAWTQWQFWQQTDTGAVAGVSGALDLDVFNGSRDELLAFAGSPYCGDGTCHTDESPTTCPADCPPPSPGPDAGLVDDGPPQGGGCSTTRGDASLLGVVIALVLRRRRRV